MNTSHKINYSKENAIQKLEISTLMDKILIVTMKFKEDFPEVYKNLDEIPLLDSNNNTKLNSNDFKQYLNTITSQLEIIKSL